MVFSKGSSSESSEESPKMFATKASAILTVYNCVCVYSALLLNNNKKNKVMLICGERRHRRKSKIREEKRRTKNDRTTKSNETR